MKIFEVDERGKRPTELGYQLYRSLFVFALILVSLAFFLIFLALLGFGIEFFY